MSVFESLGQFISTLKPESISEERTEILNPLINFIQKRVDDHKPIRLNLICTHNSRRSHMSQVWAQTMAHHFDISNVFCYSGGTAATALFPKVAETLEKQGFRITKLSETENPVYSIKFAPDAHPVVGFSKTFDDDFNPKSEFAAIMTCSQADEDCPLVPGAAARIPVTYEDPKAFDGTDLQAEKYAERSVQIATEMFYVFSKIKMA